MKKCELCAMETINTGDKVIVPLENLKFTKLDFESMIQKIIV
jgi:hypothetical protein